MTLLQPDLSNSFNSLKARKIAAEVVHRAKAGFPDLSPIMTTAAALIDDILASDTLFEEVSARSYAHPNGFEKIVLAPSIQPEDGELRVHIWREAGRRPDSKVHDHSWDMVSRVIAGHLAVRQYDTSSTGSLRLTTATPYQFQEAAYDLEIHPAEVGVEETSCHLLPVGCSYRLAAAAFHAADAVAPNTMTIVCQGPFVRPACRVLFDTGHALSTKIATESIDPKRLRVLLTTVLGLIRSAQQPA